MVYILGFLSLVELIMFFILALKDNDAFIFVMLGFFFGKYFKKYSQILQKMLTLFFIYGIILHHIKGCD